MLGPGPSPLKQARQFHKNCGRIALRRRRLAGGESDLALGHGKTSHGVHQHQYVLAEIAEVLGDGKCQIGCLPPYQWRLIGRRDNNDGARKAASAKIILQEFLDLAAALANQPDHRNIGQDVAGQHRQQNRLADA
jgi:hypothetical protein